jgi:hypothetical protein
MRFMLPLLIMLCIQARAQSDPSLAMTQGTKNTAATTAAPGDVVHAAAAAVTPRIFDRKFFLLAGIATTATVLDITTTSTCISRYSTCQESNPLLGSHPSPAKLYGVSLSLLAGEMFASAWLRHQMPRRRLWIIPPIVGAAGHGLAATLNFRTINQSNTPR